VAKLEASSEPKPSKRLILSPATKAISILLGVLFFVCLYATYHNSGYLARLEMVALVTALLVSEVVSIIAHKLPFSEIWAGLQKKPADKPTS
jgi:hypothetical protein